jgi:hypothetical protein
MKKTLFVLIAILISNYSYSQLPKGYKLIKGESPVGRDDYYTNGRINFMMDTPLMGDDYGDRKNMKSLLYSYGIVFKKTKDNLYVGAGFSNGKFRFVVYRRVAYIVTSRVNSKEFADMSNFVLNAVRHNNLFMR